MKSRFFVAILVLEAVFASPILADGRFIVRATGGLPVLQIVCSLLGCQAGASLGDPSGQLFLVTTPASTDPISFLTQLLLQPGIANAEPDLLNLVSDTGYGVPPALMDQTPVSYYGVTVPHGYVSQPATQIIRLSSAQSTFRVKGAGVVAVIDTGIDPHHPALQNSIVPGYDFTRNQPGADETLDVISQPVPFAQGSNGGWVNQSTAALVDQSTAALVDGTPALSDFGHGTMVAGVIHLVAPGAQLMPLKAFQSNGSGYTSDILRALYWAEQHGANVINMSFSLAAYSREVENAVNVGNLLGIICVASAGNRGSDDLVYPAALKNVMGVASTTNYDLRSSFSNYGSGTVWVAAPGEGIVTTYPFGHYAASWGTSFSAPFVSGTAALMLSTPQSLFAVLSLSTRESQSAQAMAHAQILTSELGNGRLDTVQALTAWHQTGGLF